MRGRVVADADRPDFALAAQVLQRPRGLRKGRLEVGPMHLVEVDDVGAQASERILDLPPDPSRTRIAKHRTVLPRQSDFGGDLDFVAQRALGERLADDLLGTAEA
jgi:hypothetical protein